MTSSFLLLHEKKIEILVAFSEKALPYIGSSGSQLEDIIDKLHYTSPEQLSFRVHQILYFLRDHDIDFVNSEEVRKLWENTVVQLNSAKA